MPKIIENLRGRLIDQTQRTLLESGYAAVTIRGIAAACGTAAGTVYNYFPSKDDLIAHAILDDWRERVAHAHDEVESCPDLRSGFSAILSCISAFNERYTPTFRQSGVSLAGPAYDVRHHMLRDQISELVNVLVRRFDRHPSATAVKVMAESLLVGATHSWPVEELVPVLEKLIG